MREDRSWRQSAPGRIRTCDRSLRRGGLCRPSLARRMSETGRTDPLWAHSRASLGQAATTNGRGAPIGRRPPNNPPRALGEVHPRYIGRDRRVPRGLLRFVKYWSGKRKSWHSLELGVHPELPCRRSWVRIPSAACDAALRQVASGPADPAWGWDDCDPIALVAIMIAHAESFLSAPQLVADWQQPAW
jgi:hypothetical protein